MAHELHVYKDFKEEMTQAKSFKGIFNESNRPTNLSKTSCSKFTNKTQIFTFFFFNNAISTI